MNITFDECRKIFRIYNHEMEYAFAIEENGRLFSLHFGALLGGFPDYDIMLESKQRTKHFQSRRTYAEYSHSEPFDFDTPCLRVRFADGIENVRLVYKAHKIEKNALYVTLKDKVHPLEVELKYTVWGDLSLIGKSCIIRNIGNETIILKSAKSGGIHLPDGEEYRLTHYAGDWASEYQKSQTMLPKSKVEISTCNFTDAAAFKMPFFALDKDGCATESFGEVYFGLLSWSGDFQISIENNIYSHSPKCINVVAGISDFTAQYPLGAGESFETPLFTIGFSNRGFEKMSETIYDWEFDYILPKGTTDKAHGVRPIIYNTWYPYQFDIDEKKLLDLIPKAQSIGAELYVIDDGWMQGRCNEKCGLGDWVTDKQRFPNGLGKISDAVHDAGMKFGLWIEPEMANYDSELYCAHPDWVLADSKNTKTQVRYQYILDMSRDDIRDWAIECLDRLVTENGLDYLKWDMNRRVTEYMENSHEQGKAIKYIQNIYYIWEHLNKEFPDLLLENCASGGGRADFGMLRYADRVNRSDNADPIDVLMLHEGYSTFFVPKLAGGAGNISPEKYPLNKRTIPFDFRANLGMTGSMSVGINLLACNQTEIDEIRVAIDKFKKIREGLQDAYVYRIASIYEHPYVVFEYMRRDKSEFTVFAFGHGMRQWDKHALNFKMRNLDEQAVYACGDMRMSGRALMNLGIKIELVGDYTSCVMTWKKI